MNCKRAVIAVGGVGSRMMPAGYAIDKCMLPIPDGSGRMRPLVDFVVQDCIDAGIIDITFIVGEGSTAIRKYYTGNEPVDRYLEARGKAKLLEAVRRIGEKATFTFIPQHYGKNEPYGTSVPLHLARDVVNQPGQTLYLLGDQFFHGAGSETKRLLEGTASAGVDTGMLVLPVSPHEVHHYGIVEQRDGLLTKITEKPAVGSIASTDANLGIMVVTDRIVPYLDKNINHPPTASGEHLFTDVMTAYATDGHDVAVVQAQGTYLDCGTPEAYLATMNYMANQRS